MLGHFTNRTWHLLWLLLWLGPPVASLAAGRGLLFELSREGEAPSYLFGTMHVADPRVLAAMDEVADSFSRADTLVLELVLDQEAAAASAAGMMLPPGRTLEDLLPKARYQRLLPLAADRGLTARQLNRMKPWALAVTLSLPLSDGGAVLDQLLYQEALAQRKTVRGLERVDEQLAVFDRMPMDLQLAMLRDVLNSAERMPQYWQALLDAYLSRDLVQLARLGERQMTDMSDQVAIWFEQRAIRDRNRLMLQRLLPLLQDGAAFVAVGALHLPGESGLLAGLQREGYRIRALW